MAFTERQSRILRAALDRIIPADDYPGAWDAGVGDFIAGLLAGEMHALAPVYEEGLDSLDAEARLQSGKPFEALGAEQQDALLAQVESGDTRADWSIPSAQFFSILVNHAAEGYYSDAGNGGNRGERSWVMIGFVPPTPNAPGARRDLTEKERSLQ